MKNCLVLFCLWKDISRGAGILIATYAAFWWSEFSWGERQAILHGTTTGPWYREATRWHAGLLPLRLAALRASYSRKAGRSLAVLRKTPFLLTSIHPARTGFDFHINGWSNLQLLSYDWNRSLMSVSQNRMENESCFAKSRKFGFVGTNF